MNYMETDVYIEALKVFSKYKLYIVGAGKYGEILGLYLNKYKIPWEGYIDKRIQLERVNGKPVYAYKEIQDGYFVVSSYLYRDEIVKELKNCGFGLNYILIYENQEIFYDLYNDLIDVRKYTEKIRIFYKKHIKKRCFIIGNGPSLKVEDLEKMKREYTFASNSIYALYKYTDWRPVYYCAGDPVFCKEMMSAKETLMKLLEGCKAAFTSAAGEGIQYRNDADMDKLFYVHRLSDKDNNGYPRFSEDCSKQVYLGGTITYDMLQLAVYMGFQEIYLLGMDFSYSVERHDDNTITKANISNHMREIEEEEKRFYKGNLERYSVTYMADIDLQLAGYKAAKEYADSHNIKIFNATRGGKLEVFQRVNFDDIFK